MIPVRVPVDAPTHIVGGVRRLSVGHPLYDQPCPVCDHELYDHPVTLVYVGADPDDRKDSGYMTGAAVAVHAVCAGLEVTD